MVTLKIRPWDTIDGITHSTTSWRVSTDLAMTNIIDELVDDSVWLTIYYSAVTVPLGVTYYASSQRTLSDGTVLPWTDPFPIRSTNNTQALLLHEEIVIEQPIVEVDEDSLLDTSTDLILNTSTARSAGDNHFSTHWIIESNDKVIFSSMYDQDNLTTISIPKDSINLSNVSSLKVTVIHNTASGIESKPGVIIKNIHEYNFEILTNLYSVDPYLDLNILFKRIVVSDIIGIRKAVLKGKFSDEVVFEQSYVTDIDRIRIPKELILPDREYALELHVVSGVYSDILYYTVNTNSNTTRSLYVNKDYTYENNIVPAGNDANTNILDMASYYETFDHFTLGSDPDTSTDLYKYVYDRANSVLTCTYDYIPGSSILDTVTGLYSRVLEGNILLTDTLNNGYPTFVTYEYNPIDNLVTIKNTIERTDEVNPIGITNAIVPIDISTLYYLQVDNATCLSILDISTGSVNKTIDHPGNPIDNGFLINLGDGRLLIGGGDNTKTFIYNISTSTWSDGIAMPLEFRNIPLRVDNLINRDAIVYRTVKDGSYDDDNILKFDHLEQDFQLIEPGTNNTEAHTSSILLADYRVLLLSKSDTLGLVKYIFQ